MIPRLYRFHVTVTFHTGAFTSNIDRKIKKSLLILVYKGPTHFSETCMKGQSRLYFQSLVDKTNALLMPSHCPDIKVTVSEDEDEDEVTEEKPSYRIKVQFKNEMPAERTKQWSSTFSTASKLLIKAKKDIMRAAVKREQKTQIHNLIFSGSLRPADIAQEARHRNRMIHVDCEVCQQQCHSLREYVRHMKAFHPDFIFKCSVCGTGYRSYNGKFKHEKTHSGSKFVCMICGWPLKSRIR